ncbi:alpha/beta hydrolase [Streptomyces sp. NPDC059917]|uniref:alpha/beta hydrolase n=1 Tax=Streptomyces sp. NPDC059917 TaxID=3347002 RepID=UPI00365CAE7F
MPDVQPVSVPAGPSRRPTPGSGGGPRRADAGKDKYFADMDRWNRGVEVTQDPEKLRQNRLFAERAEAATHRALHKWSERRDARLPLVPALVYAGNRLLAEIDEGIVGDAREKLALDPSVPNTVSLEDRFKNDSDRNYLRCMKDLESATGTPRHNAALVTESALAGARNTSLLVYEPDFEGGLGRAAVAVGAVETAEYVVVLVPGMGSSLETLGELTAHAQDLYKQCLRTRPGAKVAAVAWAGYKAPPGFAEAAREEPAAAGAALLRGDLDTWRSYWRKSAVRGALDLPAYPTLTVSGLSYGSVVAGHAAIGSGTDTAGKRVIDQLVLLGSPGTGLRAKYLDADLFVAATDTDFISMLDWFSIDPSHENHGEKVVRMRADYAWTAQAGLVGNLKKAHLSYYDRGSESLANIARAVVGRTEEISLEERRTRPLLGGYRTPLGRAFHDRPEKPGGHGTADGGHGPWDQEDADGVRAGLAEGTFGKAEGKGRKKRDLGEQEQRVPDPVVEEQLGGKKKPRPDLVKRPITRAPAIAGADASAGPKPPAVLYRVDTRPPTEGFRDGFSAYGKDMDLEKHARGATTIGRSSQARSSGFISTTSNRAFALRFAEQLLAGQHTVYLYEMVPGRSFYNLRSSLLARGGVDPSLVDHAQAQGEWVSTGRIPPDRIRSATPLSRPATGRGAPVAGPVQSNVKVPGTALRGFDTSVAPQANAHPYGKPAPGTRAAAGGLMRYTPGPDLVGPQGQRFLYRGVQQAPKSGVLVNGFSSRGFDVSERTHLSGDMRNSAYISMSWSKETARTYAGPTGWVYKIDKNKLGVVFNVYGSSGLTGRPADGAVQRNAEVAAMYYVPPEAIVDAEPSRMRSAAKSLPSRIKHKYTVWQRDVSAQRRPASASVRTGAKAAGGAILIAEKLFEIFPELRQVFAPLGSWIDDKWARAQRTVQDALMPDLARARAAREAYDAIPNSRYAKERPEWEKSLWKVPRNTHLYGHVLSARVEKGAEIGEDDVKNVQDALRYSAARVWADENLEPIKQYFSRKIREDEDGAGVSASDLADVDEILRSLTPAIVAEEYVDHGLVEFAELYAVHTERYLAEKEAAGEGRRVTIELSTTALEETQVLVPNAQGPAREVTWSVNGRAASRFAHQDVHPEHYKHGLRGGDAVVLTGVLPEGGGDAGALSLYNPQTRERALTIAPVKAGGQVGYRFAFPRDPDGASAGVEARVEADGRTDTITADLALVHRAGAPLKVSVVYPKPRTYTVKTGDGLWSIAAAELGDGSRWPEIYRANRTVIGDDPDLILGGQVLRIPGRTA